MRQTIDRHGRARGSSSCQGWSKTTHRNLLGFVDVLSHKDGVHQLPWLNGALVLPLPLPSHRVPVTRMQPMYLPGSHGLLLPLLLFPSHVLSQTGVRGTGAEVLATGENRGGTWDRTGRTGQLADHTRQHLVVSSDLPR